MIEKEEFVKRWYYGTAKERLELADTICTNKVYKDLTAEYRIDDGCTMFTKTLGELVVLKYLDMQNIDYGKIPADNFIKQRGDADIDDGGRIAGKYLIGGLCMIDIKTTGCKCVTESNTVSVRKSLLNTSKVFTANYILIVDGFYVDRKYQDRNSFVYGKFGPSDYASSHIILVNMKTGEKKILVDHEKTCELIESILAK